MADTNDASTQGPSGTPRGDKNKDKDGKNKESKFNRDRLESDLMNSEFAWAWKVIKTSPELKKLWDKAIEEGWQGPRFQAALMNSDWFQENDGYKRTIEALEKTDPATYKVRLESAVSKVRDDLAKKGISLEGIDPEELNRLGRNFLILGFDQGRNAEAYNDWLGASFVSMRGAGRKIVGNALTNQDALNALLLANGFDPNNSRWQGYVSDTVNKIALGDMSIEDAQSFVREQAATMYPVFSDRIRQGQNVQDIAAAYYQIYADTLELNPDEIKLTDPYMRAALQDVDKETGKPQAMSLWDFQKMLRKDERFQYTKQANQAADGLAASILSMFGFVG